MSSFFKFIHLLNKYYLRIIACKVLDIKTMADSKIKGKFDYNIEDTNIHNYNVTSQDVEILKKK